MNDIVLELKNIATRFGESTVHEDVNLQLRRGEILALIGGSGSGKTVLLREILLLHKPSAGSVHLFGHDSTAMSGEELQALRRRMGVLFQYGALFNNLTVIENVGLPMREHTRISDKLIDEVACLKIAMVGLPIDAANKYPGQLSGGMRKRASLARSLSLDPEMLLLDEPSSGLDPVGADELDELISKLHKSLNLTILLITHDLNSIHRIADRIAVLNQGRILTVGAKQSLVRDPHPQVRKIFHGARGKTLWGN